jgi:hypothetical protein
MVRWRRNFVVGVGSNFVVITPGVSIGWVERVSDTPGFLIGCCCWIVVSSHAAGLGVRGFDCGVKSLSDRGMGVVLVVGTCCVKSLSVAFGHKDAPWCQVAPAVSGRGY